MTYENKTICKCGYEMEFRVDECHGCDGYEVKCPKCKEWIKLTEMYYRRK